jgi:hypothetical protein
MNWKILIPLLFLYTESFSQISKNDIDTLFMRNHVKIAGEGRSCTIISSLAGDLNHDGSEDVLVYYSCGIKETIGKASTGGGWTIWLNKDGKYEYFLNDDKKFGLMPKQILPDGIILCDQLAYDSNNDKPVVKGQRRVKLTDKGLVLVK